MVSQHVTAHVASPQDLLQTAVPGLEVFGLVRTMQMDGVFHPQGEGHAVVCLVKILQQALAPLSSLVLPLRKRKQPSCNRQNTCEVGVDPRTRDKCQGLFHCRQQRNTESLSLVESMRDGTRGIATKYITMWEDDDCVACTLCKPSASQQSVHGQDAYRTASLSCSPVEVRTEWELVLVPQYLPL